MTRTKLPARSLMNLLGMYGDTPVCIETPNHELLCVQSIELRTRNHVGENVNRPSVVLIARGVYNPDS